MRQPLNVCAWLVVMGLVLVGSARADDDIDQLEIPIIESRDGYTLSLTEIESTSKQNLVDNEPAEHEVTLAGWLRGPKDADVLCFSAALQAVSAEDDRGKELLLPNRRRGQAQYAAVLPHPKYCNRKGEPILLSSAELGRVALSRPGYEVKRLTVQATAVVVREKQSSELPAIVADRYTDVGHGHQVQVASMQVDKRGVMTLKLNVRREGGDRTPVIESLYALNDKGEVIGGGRWTNQLDLFGGKYDVEMVFPLNAEKTAAKLRLDFATDYDVKTLEFKLDRPFQR